VDKSDADMRAGILRRLLTLDMEHDFEGAAQRWEVWRMCQKPRCRRARACRGDALRCCKMYVDWSEALARRDREADMTEVWRALKERLGEESA
jgi:hypothetical protein